MKNLFLAGMLVFTMAAPATALTGPISDRCTDAYDAIDTINFRIKELEKASGDFYDLKIRAFEIMVLKSLRKEPEEIIHKLCSV